MRIGIIAFLHESNTFVQQPTTLENFHNDLYVLGESIRERLATSHHEIGGFFAGLADDNEPIEAVPLVAFRATPSGIIADGCFDEIAKRMLDSIHSTPTLDGILVAVHGAAVCESYHDADGEFLSRLRAAVGHEMPVVGTIDAHANLTPQMIDNCNAIIAYRTNPHLDQRDRGREAARLLIRTIRAEIHPTMAAAFPPMLISIQRQCTEEPHLEAIYKTADQQLQLNRVLSNSVLLGFPYADVLEMGVSTIAITDNDPDLAHQLAHDLGRLLWRDREQMHGHLVEIPEAIAECERKEDARICLLDMGDNVGGGSAADGTVLVRELMQSQIGRAVACIYDPEAVRVCQQIGQAGKVELSVGGKTDRQHGTPIHLMVNVRTIESGKFHENQPRHGGILEFDQGLTAVVDTLDGKLTIVLNSLRTAPFSLQQLTSCGIEPKQYRIFVAKGVNAPIAAYRDVCDTFIRVNTSGSTCADVNKLDYQFRRQPMFPFESNATFEV